jgi:hypothetical protein
VAAEAEGEGSCVKCRTQRPRKGDPIEGKTDGTQTLLETQAQEDKERVNTRENKWEGGAERLARCGAMALSVPHCALEGGTTACLPCAAGHHAERSDTNRGVG